VANFADLTAMGCDSVSSTALENGHLIFAHQAVLYGFDGRNTDGSNEAFIYVFDKASAPVSGTDIPKIVLEVGAAGTGGAGNFFYTNPATIGEKFTNGIYIQGCSTDFNGSTFTALASNKLFFHVQYAPEDGLTSP
jgi:hypothetical protein